MKIKDIQFKVSASRKLLCNLCKKSVFGEEGFVRIKYNQITCWGNKSDTILCWKCLSSSLMHIEEDRKNRIENFNKLLKKQIVRKL